MNKPLNILMVAAENDGIPRCKVGGIGDVIRDIPAALAAQGCHTSIVTPSYGYLHKLPGTIRTAIIHFTFAGQHQRAELYRVPPRTEAAGHSVHYVIDHPEFIHYNAEKEQYNIYSDDPSDRPFATDATQFACFCAAVAAAVQDGLFGTLNTLHLHDWHAALLLLLRRYDPAAEALRNLRTIYTIHNLALQGIRPLSGDASSLASWYPTLSFGNNVPDELRDPRWPDCINPMAIGIRLADSIHTVSPSYAQEILEPSRPPQFFGGEGLEHDLRWANGEGRLHGILNGCEYPEPRPEKQTVKELLNQLKSEVNHWAAQRAALSFADYTALQTLDKLQTARSKPAFIATSISRVVDQKMLLLKATGSDNRTGLEKILDALGSKRLYILLGTGDRDTETFLTKMASAHSNFLFLNSYSAKAADLLYASGDLFLMPSSFEPCGIGQMLALRDGQPCLVHSIGGLHDTIQHGINGFGFGSDTLCGQVDGMATALSAALELHATAPEKWQAICKAAAETRFLWAESAKQYIEQLY